MVQLDVSSSSSAKLFASPLSLTTFLVCNLSSKKYDITALHCGMKTFVKKRNNVNKISR